MSIISRHVDGSQNVEHIASKLVKAQNTINFATKNEGNGDVIEVLKIPAGAFVLRVIVRIDTAEGATATATVGDGSGAADWDAAVNLNGSVNTVTTQLAGTDSYAEGKYYASDDTIDFTLGHDMDAGICTVCAIYLMME